MTLGYVPVRGGVAKVVHSVLGPVGNRAGPELPVAPQARNEDPPLTRHLGSTYQGPA